MQASGARAALLEAVAAKTALDILLREPDRVTAAIETFLRDTKSLGLTRE